MTENNQTGGHIKDIYWLVDAESLTGRTQGLTAFHQVSALLLPSLGSPHSVLALFWVGFLHTVATGSFRLITSIGKKSEKNSSFPVVPMGASGLNGSARS